MDTGEPKITPGKKWIELNELITCVLKTMSVSKHLLSTSCAHKEPQTSPGPGTRDDRKVSGGVILSHRRVSLVLNSH